MPSAAVDQAGENRAAAFQLRNLQPLPGWFVTVAFLGTFAALTWTLKVKGTEWRYPIWLQYAALLLLWTGGYIGVGHFVRRPCTWLRVQPGGGVLLTRVWPLRIRRDRIPPRAIAGVEVREGVDSEGDPYFHTALVLATGEAITVQQGHREERQQAIAAQLRAALRLPPAH